MNEQEKREPKRKQEPGYLTFVHRFAPDLTVTLRVLDQAPKPGSGFAPNLYWDGRPTQKIAKAYRKWILRTNQILVDHWQIVYTYGLLLTPTKMEIWVFTPGEKPSLKSILTIED